mgnify:CR=1 FL=1
MANFKRKYPLTRLRRLRANRSIRDLVAENKLSVDDLVQPIFVKESLKDKEVIESLPEIFRHSEKSVLKEIEELVNLGIKAVAIFPVIDEDKKDEKGSEAINENNFLNNVIKKIKQNFPEILVIADVALDPYTTHGHDGVLNSDGDVDNDMTLKMLKEQALNLAKVGTDIIAPSDMMDGRIKLIRKELENKKFFNTKILSYSAKYASNYYGPFRDAVGSMNMLGKSDKKTYQMDFFNRREALREIDMDLREGADLVMVKPALPYLDIISDIKNSFAVPVFAYHVSGEYLMIKSAAKNKSFDEKKIVIETLIAIRRAGASSILTYYAKEASQWLR